MLIKSYKLCSNNAFTKRISESDKLIFIPHKKVGGIMEYLIHNLSKGYLDRIKLKVDDKNKPVFSEKNNMKLVKDYLNGYRIENNSNINLNVLTLKHKKYYNKFIKESIFNLSIVKPYYQNNVFDKIYQMHKFNLSIENFWSDIKNGKIESFSYNLSIWSNFVEMEKVDMNEDIHKRVLKKDFETARNKKLN